MSRSKDVTTVVGSAGSGGNRGGNRGGTGPAQVMKGAREAARSSVPYSVEPASVEVCVGPFCVSARGPSLTVGNSKK